MLDKPMTTDKLAHALDYIAKGIRVFPLWPGTRIPAINAFPTEATTDEKTVRAWWEDNPHYNIGVATGRGIVAIDADVKKGRPGLVSLAALDLEILPATFRSNTPSGGSHTLLKVDRPIANRVDSIDGYPGIDIRGENGYVVGVGSTTPDGAYTISDDVDMAIAPAELYDVLGKRPKHQAHTDNPIVELDTDANVRKATNWLTTSAPSAIEGEGGDHVTFQTAAMLRDFGLSQATALDLLLDHWNEAKAEPPWQPDELALKVQNAFTYATGSWGGKTAAADFDLVEDNSEFPSDPIELGTPPTKDAIAAAAGKKPPTKWRFVRFGTSAANATDSPQEPLVDGILNCGTAAVMYGRPGAAKTFNALDMGAAIAAGRPWCGRDTTQGVVIYVAAEGAGGLNKRIAALKIHRDLPDDLPFWLCPVQINLGTSSEDAAALVRYAHRLAELAGAPLRLIIFDTLAQSMGGGDENSARDMSVFSDHVAFIRASTGAATLVIHHTGKDESRGARGSNALLGTLDTEIYVSAEGEISTTKQRDMELLREPILFKLIDVEVGEDAKGRAVGSAGVEYLDASEFDAPAVLSGDEMAFFDVFKALAAVSELEGRGGVVTWKEWLFAYHRSLDAGWVEGEKPPCSRRRAFDLARAVESAKGVIKKERGVFALGNKKA